MKSTSTPVRSWRPTVPLLLALCSLKPSGARAAVSEPDPTIGSVPKPVAASEITNAANVNPPSEVRLDRLFLNRNENIDFVRDAQTTPATFSPLCGFTG